MAEFKDIETFSNKIENETEFWGRDGWRSHSIKRHPLDDSKVLITFVKGE